MATDHNDQSNYKELAEKIQQFLSHQVESNSELSEAAKESLTVATECIEQAYNFNRKPASTELVDIYQAHKADPPRPLPQNPAELITNLASSFLSQVGGSLPREAANLASDVLNQANQQPQPDSQARTGPQQSQSAERQQQQSQTGAQPAASRKKATEAEKLAADSFKTQGNDLMKQDKYKEAYDCYTQAIEIDNNNAVYYCNRAAASAKLNNHQAALKDCEEALQIDSNYSKAYGRMALAYASMDNHQKAKEAYLKAVELDPTNESYRNNLAIAEEKLASSRNFSGLGAAAAGAAGGASNPAIDVIQSLFNNPTMMNMAMRSLQDPRMQNLLSNFGAAAAQGAAGANQNNGQPR